MIRPASKKSVGDKTSRRPSVSRLELLNSLKAVSPALATDSVVPAFGNFQFSANRVTAYNGVFAIRNTSPLVCLDGCVQGNLLLQLLSASHAETVEELVVENKQINLKVGRANVELPLLPKDDLPLDLPDSGGEEIPLPSKMPEVLKALLAGMGREPARPLHFGVTVSIAEERLVFFVTDENTATRVRVKVKGLPKALVGQSFGLPPQACDMLARVGDSLHKAHWRVSPGSHLEAEAGDLWVMSRLNEKTSVGSYQRVFKDHEDVALVAVPVNLHHILRRAAVILDAAGDDKCAFLVGGGKIRVDVQTTVGNLTESVKWEGGDDLHFVADPRPWLRGLERASHMGFGSGSIVMSAAEPFSWRYVTSATEVKE